LAYHKTRRYFIKRRVFKFFAPGAEWERGTEYIL
jgi:hypothetical protein